MSASTAPLTGVDAVLAVLSPNYRNAGAAQWMAPCPACNSALYEQESLHISDVPRAPRGVRMRCDNGCEEEAVAAALGLPPLVASVAYVAPEVQWPSPVAEEARHGLAGRVLEVIEPHSEADPHAILFSFLAAIGNLIGRGPGFQAEGDFHATNLFVAVVGETAKARKGTSFGRIRQLLGLVDTDYVRDRIRSGLSSGEGLVWQVRDAITKLVAGPTGEYEEKTEDPGEEDKRLLVQEGELAQGLKVMRREGNTLSVAIRNLWDNGNQGSLTRNSPARTTGALVSIVGHISRDELRAGLGESEYTNGFANRFLFVCARRSKCLPDGGNLDERDLEPLAAEINDLVTFARRLKGPLYRDDEARNLWHQVYPELSDGRPGLLGAVTARAEAQVMRLAVLYALLDQRTQVGLEHLQAALAAWDYCDRSAQYIFGGQLGDAVADDLLAQLRARPNGMTRKEIRDHFNGHQPKQRIDRALSTLQRAGRARMTKEPTGGRPVERWFAVDESREEPT